MIPEPTPSRLSPENGVRYRVAACRQRLRNSRITHRATNNSQINERSAELPDFPAGMSGADSVLARGGESVRLPELPDLVGEPVRRVLAANEELEEVGIT